MLNRRPIVEDHRQTAEGKLAARLDSLKAAGLSDKQIQKDPKIKKFKADIRKARHQMAGIVAMENLKKEKADAKTQKTAAAKAPAQESKKKVKSAVSKKPKKDKKAAAADTE